MKINEAYDKAEKGDIIRNEVHSEKFIKGQASQVEISVPSAACSDDWEVIRTKKEPITWEEGFEIFSQAGIGASGQECCYRNGWKASEKNRDLLYADLLEVATEIRDIWAGSEEMPPYDLRDKLCVSVYKIKQAIK